MKLNDILNEEGLSLSMLQPLQKYVLRKLGEPSTGVGEDGQEVTSAYDSLKPNEQRIADQLIDMGLVDELTNELTPAGQQIASQLQQMTGDKLENPLANRDDDALNSFKSELEDVGSEYTDVDMGGDPTTPELKF